MFVQIQKETAILDYIYDVVAMIRSVGACSRVFNCELAISFETNVFSSNPFILANPFELMLLQEATERREKKTGRN